MDIRYSAHPNDVKRYTTEELRREFLIENLYRPDQVVAVYSHVDRMVTLGCMPVKETVSIDKGIDVWANFGTRYFLERREVGMFNIGGDGSVTVDGTVYELGYKDCLYITMGAREVLFASRDSATGSVYRVRSVVVTSGQINAFHVETKVKIVREIVAGFTSGSTTLQKM